MGMVDVVEVQGCAKTILDHHHIVRPYLFGGEENDSYGGNFCSWNTEGSGRDVKEWKLQGWEPPATVSDVKEIGGCHGLRVDRMGCGLRTPWGRLPHSQPISASFFQAVLYLPVQYQRAIPTAALTLHFTKC